MRTKPQWNSLKTIQFMITDSEISVEFSTELISFSKLSLHIAIMFTYRDHFWINNKQPWIKDFYHFKFQRRKVSVVRPNVKWKSNQLFKWMYVERLWTGLIRIIIEYHIDLARLYFQWFRGLWNILYGIKTWIFVMYSRMRYEVNLLDSTGTIRASDSFMFRLICICM